MKLHISSIFDRRWSYFIDSCYMAFTCEYVFLKYIGNCAMEGEQIPFFTTKPAFHTRSVPIHMPCGIGSELLLFSYDAWELDE